MIDIIKIREAQHGITSFLSASIDCFCVCVCVCVHVFSKLCCNGAVSREKKSSFANNFHV